MRPVISDRGSDSDSNDDDMVHCAPAAFPWNQLSDSVNLDSADSKSSDLGSADSNTVDLDLDLDSGASGCPQCGCGVEA